MTRIPVGSILKQLPSFSRILLLLLPLQSPTLKPHIQSSLEAERKIAISLKTYYRTLRKICINSFRVLIPAIKFKNELAITDDY